MPENTHCSDVSKKIDSLPVSMKVADVADFLGIALSTAYKLVNAPGFPRVDIAHIRRTVIPKDRFLQWYYATEH